jgi:hypothetical protein
MALLCSEGSCLIPVVVVGLLVLTIWRILGLTNREVDAKDAKADIQVDGTEEGETRSNWSAGVRRQVRQRVVQLAVKAAGEGRVKRWMKEKWINDPWLEGELGELGPVTTQESRAVMMGGELEKGGRAGWEEGKKYQLRHGPETRHTGSK